MIEPTTTKETLFCPICKCETREKGKPDSIGTQFYKCKHGHQTSKALNTQDLKINMAFEIQAEQNREVFVDPLNPASAFVNGKGVFKTALVAQYLQYNEHFKTDLKTGIFYFYDGKSWIPNAEAYLEKIVAVLLGEENTKSAYINIIHDLKGLTYDTIEFSRKIATPNGLFNVETLELTPNTAEEMPLFSIPTEYVKDTPFPQWQAWLNQVMPNKEDQMLLQEWSGYILLPDYRFHKLLFNYGEGRNGKGTWERTIQAVIGKNNCSEVALEEFNGFHRFALYQLYGKLLNLCSEPTTSFPLQTSLIKKMTGQDTISAERKGSDKRVDYTNTAKITVSANKFPKVEDTTTAFKERRLFLNWVKQYLEGNEQIQWIERNWIQGEHDERKGILCWMLEGLQRLLAQRHFTRGKTQQETEILYQRASDTISAFITEMGIFDKNLVTTRSQAFEAYKGYCDVYGLEVENEKRFTQTLKETPRVSVTTVSIPKRERAWKGFSLKLLDEDPNLEEILAKIQEEKERLEAEEKAKAEANNTPVTDITDVTRLALCNLTDSSNIEESRRRVTSDTPVTEEESDLSKYEQLSCYFCQKAIINDEWTSDDFSANKPAHKKCYDDTKAQLKGDP